MYQNQNKKSEITKKRVNNQLNNKSYIGIE